MKLKSQVPKSTLLIHGTSIEAIAYLLKNGQMPTAPDQKYFFFEIINEKGVIEKLDTRGEELPLIADFETISNLEQYLGRSNVRRHFLQKHLGYVPEWFYNVWDENSQSDWSKWLEDETNSRKAKSLSQRLVKRKGVLISPTLEFAQRNPLIIGDPDDGIRFETCEFRLEDIDFVVPQGLFERKLLERFEKNYNIFSEITQNI